jgi:hypothetical protein
VHYVAYGTPGGEFPAIAVERRSSTELDRATEGSIPLEKRRGAVTRRDGICVLNPTKGVLQPDIRHDRGTQAPEDEGTGRRVEF